MEGEKGAKKIFHDCCITVKEEDEKEK